VEEGKWDIVKREKQVEASTDVFCSSLLPVPSEKMCPKAELKGDGKRNNIILEIS